MDPHRRELLWCLDSFHESKVSVDHVLRRAHLLNALQHSKPDVFYAAWSSSGVVESIVYVLQTFYTSTCVIPDRLSGITGVTLT